MKATKADYNKFWDDVLGDNWYIDEGECPEPDDPEDTVYDIDDAWVAWQGKEKNPSDRVCEYLTGPVPYEELTHLKLQPIYEKWLLSQTHTTLVATFTVPKAEAAAFRAKLKELGATLSDET